ncbi:MAG: glycosyltransferase family 4 protein [Sarcina sp.]
MKILIDSRGASWYRGTGIGTYTHNLLQALISLDRINDYHLFCSGNEYCDYKSTNTKILMSSKKHKTFFEEFYMPKYSKDKNIDIFHVPQNGIGLINNNNCLNIATIHDLIPYVLPQTTGPGYLKNFMKKIPIILEACDGILTVSEYSKNDILKFFPSFPSERIFVTPLAANSNFKPANKDKNLFNVQKKFNFDTKYIMYVGGFSPRKNVQNLLESFNEIYDELNDDIRLLIVGSLRDEGKRLENLSKTFKHANKIIFTGFIEEDYLPVLYSGCSLFVYPSLYEGFGLPPLEAMSCKTAVLASNLTSIPEVVKLSDLLFNPYNTLEFKVKLKTLLNDTNLLNSLSEKCYNLSKEFSWKNTAKSTLFAFNELYKMGKK